jgi:hypothetical protein
MSMLAGLGPAWHRHQAMVVLSGLSTRRSQSDRGLASDGIEFFGGFDLFCVVRAILNCGSNKKFSVRLVCT